MIMIVSMLTTEDNPFDPFEQFDDWFAFDTQKGYHSLSYLDRIAHTSPELSPEDYNNEITRAIDEILRFNLTGNYKVVRKEIS